MLLLEQFTVIIGIYLIVIVSVSLSNISDRRNDNSGSSHKASKRKT